MKLIMFLVSLIVMIIYLFNSIKTTFIFLTKFKNIKYDFLSRKKHSVFLYTLYFFLVNLVPIIIYIILLLDNSLDFLVILLSSLSAFFYNKFILVSKKGLLTTFNYIEAKNIKLLDFVSCNYTVNLEVITNNEKIYLFNTFFYSNYYYKILCNFDYGSLFKKTSYNFQLCNKINKLTIFFKI